MSDDINLNQLVSRDHKYELSLSNETADDAAARRVKEAADADQKRKINFALFIFSLFITGVVFVGCIVNFIYGSPDDKKWSAGIVSGISTGLIGFLVGQSKK